MDDINQRDQYGSTALMVCGKFGTHECKRLDVARYLIEKGADLNVQDKHGRTALMRFAFTNYTQLLLDSGADVNLVDKDGKSAVFAYPFYDYYYDTEIVNLLVKAGCDVNFKDFSGITPLMSSIHKDMSISLLNNGTDINARDNEGYSVLMRAMEVMLEKRGQDDAIKCFEFMLENGADINIRSNEGRDIIEHSIRCSFSRPALRLRSYLENKTLLASAKLKDIINIYNQSTIKTQERRL